jgi:hypothetical protein
MCGMFVSVRQHYKSLMSSNSHNHTRCLRHSILLVPSKSHHIFVNLYSVVSYCRMRIFNNVGKRCERLDCAAECVQGQFGMSKICYVLSKSPDLPLCQWSKANWISAYADAWPVFKKLAPIRSMSIILKSIFIDVWKVHLFKVLFTYRHQLISLTNCQVHTNYGVI